MFGIGNGRSSRIARARTRGLGTPAAAIIMVIVLVGVGAGSYVAFSGTKSGSPSSTLQSCQPSTSPICDQLSGIHDIFLSVPYRSVAAQLSLPFTADFTGAGKPSYFLYNFGDGTPVLNSTQPTVQHTYANAGTYIASVQAKIAGSNVLHDNYRYLLIVSVTPNAVGTATTEVPGIVGTILQNSSSSTDPTAVLDSTSESVQFNASYTTNPTDPNSVPIAPTLTVPTGGTQTMLTTDTASAQAQYTFSTSGTYLVTMVGGGKVGSTTYWQNYSWTVFVAPAGFHPGWISGGTGNTGAGATYTGSSPHPGTLDIYELVPGEARTLDPAVNYDTQGFEVIDNIYQTLIAYNGSNTGPSYSSYVPQLATCVPGSPQCAAMYGGGFTGISSDGQNWTFVISPTAQFDDPHTGAHWGVYPSDVMFSMARTLGFATGIGVGSTAGWILSQALLDKGNGTWDSLHGVFNNTPANVLSSMSINDSNCPASAMQNAHGCITFHADGGGHPWPFFLEFIVDGQGAGITPCGYFTANGASVPGWTEGASGDSGDHPCLLPGNATTTTSSAFTSAVQSLGPKLWDSWEMAGAGMGGTYPGNVQYNPAGSGPYFLKQFLGAEGYILQANPNYAAPCGWTGCEPAPGTYARTVSVEWETSATPGEQAYKAGIADYAWIPQTQLPLLLSLVNGGSVSIIDFPSISIYFFPMDMNFDFSGAQSLVPNVNVPSTFLSDVTLRQFLVHAYPYTTIQNTIQEEDGMTFNVPYGGAIPLTMEFNQQNISWPSTDPTGSASTPNSAAWWWAQATNASDPATYDPQLAACTTGTPCILPMIGELGAPYVDEQIAAWGQEIQQISGGRLQLGTTDLIFNSLVGDSTQSPPGDNPLPMFQLGWAPDYPDPTDYVAPMYLANNSYTFSDAVEQQLSNQTQGYNSSSCHSYADYGYWAEQANNPAGGGIPEKCQGAAYTAMNFALNLAALESNITQRNILYWQAESIANGLALYVYWGQSNIIENYASWLNGSSFNENVTIGGGLANTWFSLTYVKSGNGVTD